jgi:vacuolar-type H+-ATPase subunit H
MPDLDFINQIRNTEQQAANRISQAVENARLIKEDSRQRTAEIIRSARAQADMLVQDGLARAELQARQLLLEAHERSSAESAECSLTSGRQLEKAAALVVERIVGEYVHR